MKTFNKLSAVPVGVAALLLFLSMALQGAAQAEVPVATGATVSVNTPVSATYYVSLKGFSTKIFIRNGTYRESVGNFSTSVNNAATAIFQGESAGGVIISGAEQLTGWTQSGSSWYVSWKQNWGVQPWRYSITTPSNIVRRKEVLFFGSTQLRQVLTGAELGPGKYWVDETSNKIWMQPSSGQSMGSQLIMSSDRAGLWKIANRSNLVFSNLSFKRDNTYVSADVGGEAAFRVSGGSGAPVRNILIENCRFAENNAHGCIVGSWADNVTIRNSQFDSNGHVGLQTFRNRNLLVEDCQMNGNNWRGNWGNYQTWSPCGFKAMYSRACTWRRNTAADNYGAGMWFDTDNANLRVENNFATRNAQQGIYIEYNQGPVLAYRNIATNNGNSGFFVDVSNYVKVVKNVAWGNNGFGLKVREQDTRSDSTNFETNATLVLSTRDLLMWRNSFVGNGGTQGDLSFPPSSYNGGLFFSTLDSSGSNFWAVNYSGPFRIGAAYYNLNDYRYVSGQDTDSTFANPRFVDPANNNFGLQTGNPIAGWGLPTAPLDF